MISPENLSVAHLKQAFLDGSAANTRVDENGCLQVMINEKTFLVAVIGPHQVRFFIPSSVVVPSGQGQSKLFRIANELNSDLSFVAGAYVSDEDSLVFTHSFSVSGGVSEWNVVMALHEFAVEHAIFEQLVEKRFANGDA